MRASKSAGVMFPIVAIAVERGVGRGGGIGVQGVGGMEGGSEGPSTGVVGFDCSPKKNTDGSQSICVGLHLK